MYDFLDYLDNNKDIKIASDFNTALKLGCFDQEFVYYGIGYMENGTVKYKVSSNKINLQMFYMQSTQNDIYSTNIIRYDKLCPVPSGKEEATKLQLKKQTAEVVREKYNKIFFSILENVSHIPPSDNAYELLKECQEHLEGEYDYARIRLFEQLVQIAVNSKCLTIRKMVVFQAWIKEQYKQLENDLIRTTGYYKKSLYGFAYKDDKHKVHYFYDAAEHVVNDVYIEKQMQGIICSPIHRKKIVINSMNLFREEKQKFQDEMHILLGEEYLDLVCKIKEMPSIIDEEVFNKKCNMIKQYCSEEAYQTFLGYGFLWNIKHLPV